LNLPDARHRSNTCRVRYRRPAGDIAELTPLGQWLTEFMFRESAPPADAEADVLVRVSSDSLSKIRDDTSLINDVEFSGVVVFHFHQGTASCW
jgi:hypothetical protein